MERMISFRNLMIITLCAIFFVSCSSEEKKRSLEQKLDDFSVEVFPNYKNKWFDTAEIHRVYDRSGQIQRHMFFDPEPEIDEVQKTINAIVTTPVDSAYSYDLDLVSGLTYKTERYCEQTDVWQTYDKPILYPPYTEAIVPRILDKLGRPQTILIFGNNGFYSGRLYYNTRKVKVIGGLVEQYCELGHCTGANSWQTHLVLFAVDLEDSEFSKIETIEQLQQKVDWAYVKAFRENGNGRNIIAKSNYPAYRFGGFVRARSAINYIKKQSRVFNSKDLYKMRDSCISLYEFIWEHIGRLPEKGELKLSKKAVKEMKEKIQNLKKDFESKDKKYVKHKRYDFVNNFATILDSFGEYYQTCTDYVKPSNVNKGFRRHWFFSYFTAVMKLYQMGHYYNCSNQAWYYNPINIEGKPTHDNVKNLEMCTNRELNKGFSFSIPYLSTLKLSGSRYYRFVDYDNGEGGTHHKIYSWVSVKPQRLLCDKSIIDLYKNKKMQQEDFLFPNDIRWSPIGRPIIEEKEKAASEKATTNQSSSSK